MILRGTGNSLIWFFERLKASSFSRSSRADSGMRVRLFLLKRSSTRFVCLAKAFSGRSWRRFSLRLRLIRLVRSLKVPEGISVSELEPRSRRVNEFIPEKVVDVMLFIPHE